MASSLFHSEGLVALARYVKTDTLYVFDLNVTLSSIVAEHSAAQVAESVKTTLLRLMNVAKVSVIANSSRKDALRVLGFAPHLLIGNYGAEWPSQENSRNWNQVKYCLQWRKLLYDMLIDVQGVEIMFNGESISLNYRKADDPGKALSLINAAIENLEPSPRSIGGKFVVNILPAEALTKGEVLLAAMEYFGSKRVIYFGDDETGEEVFRLRSTDIFGVHVGKNDQTAASQYLYSQSELLGLLNSMVGILETH